MLKTKLTRRNFLTILTGSGVATGLSPLVRQVALEPYVQPPEEALPGRATWYATSCRQCPAGCGVIVRVINGRPRKIEGNAAHPLNRGKICARGQSGLQVLYNPDRVQNALHQKGGRGSRSFQPITWDDALETLADSLTSMGNPEELAFLSGQPSHHLYTLVNQFLESFGGPRPWIFDLHGAIEGRDRATAMSYRWFGANQAPIYDIAHSDVVYSFGANFLETWMSPVAQSHNYGDMRQGQLGGRGMLIHFEPRLSSTAASADEWYPISPGTEGMVALGIGRIIVEENLGRTGAQRKNAHLFRNVDINLISDISGVEIEKLQRLARIFAEANRPVAIPGGNLAGHSNVDDAMDAVMALNLILRRFGREGGVFLPMQVPAAPYAQEIPSTSFSQVLDLVDRMKGGRVQTLFIHGTNPVYDLPPWVGFVEALEHVPLVVSFSSFIDETAVQADYILPDHTYLEGWGYHVPSPGTDRPFVSSQQPVIQPLYDTRSTGDVFIHLAHHLGGEVSEALPWADEEDFLEQSSANLFGSSISVYDSNSPDGFWSRWRQYGGWWSQKPIWTEPELKNSFSEAISVPSATFNGDEEDFPFILMPYETVTLGDGRGANQPWLQETPDPMTTARWNTWIEINPETAKNLELENNDIVRVISTQGVLEAPVVIFPGIRPEVVAIPIGQGHQDYGRFASGRGSNVMDLIAQIESIPEEMNWASTRVRLERVGLVKNLARLENLDGEGRETIR